MIDNWMIPRPKRRLTQVPQILQAWSVIALRERWQGDRDRHLSFEDTLELAGVKAKGDRRDQRGSGGRTYAALLKALGLTFTRSSNRESHLTIAGEELVKGTDPVKVLTRQIMRFQYPSAYSVSRGVKVAERFKVRPFVLLFELMLDPRLTYLSQSEVAEIVIHQGISNSQTTVDGLVEGIRSRREAEETGTTPLPVSGTNKDIANTILNWLEYTQLVDREKARVSVASHRLEDVKWWLDEMRDAPLLAEAANQETFQRKFGRGGRQKDLRRLDEAAATTMADVEGAIIKTKFFDLASRRPITELTPKLVHEVATATGIREVRVQEYLLENFPKGAFDQFLAQFVDLASGGARHATDFERATHALFSDIFGFKAEWVGPKGREPDIYIEDDDAGYSAIIDNKAYARYDLSRSDQRALTIDYVPQYLKKGEDTGRELRYFTYVAAGFSPSVGSKIANLAAEVHVNGSAIRADLIARAAQEYSNGSFTREDLSAVLECNREVSLADIHWLTGGEAQTSRLASDYGLKTTLDTSVPGHDQWEFPVLIHDYRLACAVSSDEARDRTLAQDGWTVIPLSEAPKHLEDLHDGRDKAERT